MDAVAQVPAPYDEPAHTYAPGSPERARLERRLKELAATRSICRYVKRKCRSI